ncbi:hypothetical protein B0O80DRAFT_95336 [Mortierella sp. GBAus27b]|nr:hypothetical protein B0O80DRAFT_95336 [Mortierella sp. GBAus27b]
MRSRELGGHLPFLPLHLHAMALLTEKDVLEFSTNLDPHVHTDPYPIPADAPDPVVMNLPFDEFRRFWYRERTAFQWEACREKNAKSITNSKGDPDHPLPTHSTAYLGRGRPRQYDWTVKYRCRHRRPAKLLKIHRDSVGKGCPVTIRLQKPVGEDRVMVKYFRHHNHDTSPESRAAIPLGINERNWLKAKVDSGLNWKGIKNELLPDEKTMESLEAGKENVPPTFLLKYQDVHSELYRRKMKECARDVDVVKSVDRWMQEIEQEGGKGCFRDCMNGDPMLYMIAWCTKFQLEMMEDSLIACLDSTHGVAKPLRKDNDASVYLFAIMVKDRVLHKGFPIAYMLCSSESS